MRRRKIVRGRAPATPHRALRQPRHPKLGFPAGNRQCPVAAPTGPPPRGQAYATGLPLLPILYPENNSSSVVTVLDNGVAGRGTAYTAPTWVPGYLVLSPQAPYPKKGI
jgi:hypothetical protein